MGKTASELGKILDEMYNKAPNKEKVTMIHLFGVMYHEDIKREGTTAVIDESHIRSSYKTELSKGINLARYVIPRPFKQR